MAGALARTKIAIIIGGLRYEAQTLAIQGILDTIRAEDAEAYLFTCDSSWVKSSGQDSMFELLRYREYDGIVFYGDTLENDTLLHGLLDEIRSSGVPAVSIKDAHEGLGLAGVDNFTGVRDIVFHLARVHGAKRINFVAGAPASVDAKERLDAFLSAMAELGLPCGEDQIRVGYFRPSGGKEAFRAWYDAREAMPLPDAIVCASDWMAIGVYEEAKRCGVRVPEDLLLTGFDNTLVSAIMETPLTTIPLPSYESGQLAGEHIFRMIREGNVPDPKPLVPKPIYRKSCGCIGSADDLTEKTEEIRRIYYSESLHRVNYLDVLKSMQSELTDISTWDEFYRIIERRAAIFNADAFFFCVNLPHQSRSGALAEILDELKNDVANQNPVMKVPVALVRGKSVECKPFPKKQLMSEEMHSHVPGSFYVILPLHYQSHKFGYCVACNSKMAYENAFYSLFIQIINSAMENLRKKERLEKMVSILDELWIYDRLTGVMNREGFLRHAEGLIAEARDGGETLFLLFADLDGLKSINDTYGHDKGDEYILEAANILRSLHRKGELLMRFGGDEFVILARGYDENDAVRYVKAIEESVEAVNRKALGFPVSISLGYTIKRAEDDFSLDEMIEEADQKMYQMKKAHKMLRK